MLLKNGQATYWTFTIIAVLFTGLLGYVIGYSLQWDNDTIAENGEHLSGKQLAVSEAILDEQVINALYPQADIIAEDAHPSLDIATADLPIHAFTGYIDAINETSVLVHYPEADTEWEDALSFTLTPTTIYADLVPDEANRIGTYVPQIEVEVEREFMAVGDIITVYTVEDIRENTTRTVTKIQRITN